MCWQARALGDQLVVGLIPDSEILRCKGPPVMPEAERRIMVDSVKWVGEVITGLPPIVRLLAWNLDFRSSSAGLKLVYGEPSQRQVGGRGHHRSALHASS